MNKLKTWFFIVVTGCLFINNITAKPLTEDQIRITDIHYIASLVESYKEKTGYYPFAREQERSAYSFEVQIGLNHIVNSYAHNGFKPKDNSIKEIDFKYFEEELK